MQGLDKRNISDIVTMELCTGCGTCSALCSQNAISMKRDQRGLLFPEVNSAKCTSCGICRRVCPGMQVDFKDLNQRIFGRQPTSGLLGNCVECYSGNCHYQAISETMSSGGVATRLLVYALERGLIDGAIVTQMNKEKPLSCEPVVARNVDQVVSAAGSKYCQSPTNIKLRDVAESKGRFAVIGLPCQIHAIRKAQVVFPELKERIPLLIGLFCAHTSSFETTELLLKRMHISTDDVAELSYRGHGWPGSMLMKTRKGATYKIPYSRSFKAYYPLFDSPFFVPWRCMFCQDHFNQLADISLGDAWLKQFKGSKVGQSLIVSRSKYGQQLLANAISDKAINLKKIEAQKVIWSQENPLVFKSKSWNVRLSLASKMKYKVPSCSVTDEYYSSIGAYIVSLSYLRSQILAKNSHIKAALDVLPLWFFRADNILLIELAKLL